MTNARRLHSSNLGFIDNIVPGVPSHAVTVKKCFQLLCAESTKRTYFCLSSTHTFGKFFLSLLWILWCLWYFATQHKQLALVNGQYWGSFRSQGKSRTIEGQKLSSYITLGSIPVDQLNNTFRCWQSFLFQKHGTHYQTPNSAIL